MGLIALLAAIGPRALTVPVDPDADEARRWVLDELSKPEYSQAQPSWFDRIAQAVLDWLSSLQFDGVGGPPGLPTVLLVTLGIAVIVVAFLVFGVPRLNRRSAASGSLFGDDDNRTADQMRAAASAAAAAGDYTLAVAERFRAIARGLVERTVLTVTPGTTARDFGVRAGNAFPDSRDDFQVAASAFDAVRYLDRTGTREQYDHLTALDATIGTARPVLEAVRS